MPTTRHRTTRGAALLGASLLALAGCESNGSFDGDLRHFGTGGFDTSDAAMQATAAPPAADARGIISYPTYQVAIARRGDTVGTVASRIGVPAPELASYNALTADTVLREGEVLALPRRVAEPLPGTGLSVTTIASDAINRAESGQTGTTAIASAPTGGSVTAAPLAPAAATAAAAPAGTQAAAAMPAGAEPARHVVARGETAYSIARLYDVNVRALADWNGLGTDLAVREGQTLLIPVAATPAPAATSTVTAPGSGSPTPTPPSATQPLPDEETAPTSEPVAKPPSPDLGAQTTAASDTTKFAFPVQGQIIRGYQKKKNDGIDIGAAAGTAVKAAGDGTVAAITKDTDQVPILVIRHDNNLLTVYANIDGIIPAKGAKVKRGETIAKVRASEPAFLHFEVRQGFDSVDPMPFLQ